NAASSALVPKRPLQHLCIGRLRKSPTAVRYEPSHITRELATVEKPDRARLQRRIYRKCALHAAMRPLGITVVKMRTHDPKGQVLLYGVVKGRTSESGAKRPLSCDQESATKKRPNGRTGDHEAGRVTDRLRQTHLRERLEFSRNNLSHERDVFRSQPLP